MSQLHPILEMVHEMRAIASNLLSAGDCTKHDLSKASSIEGSIRDASDNLVSSLDDSHAPMIPIKNQASDVLSWHFRQLPLKYVLQASE